MIPRIELKHGATRDQDQGWPSYESSQSLPPRPARWEIIPFLGSLTLFTIISLLVISQGSPLGHDEAVYAARSREILNGGPASAWWAANRAPGLPFLLTFAWIGNGTEPYLRLVVTSSGVLLLFSTWLLGRLLVGPRAALVAAYGIAVSPVILMSASQVWPDVPGAAFGMAAMCVYAYGLISKRFHWWTVAVVIALVGFATMMRYGAPIPAGIGLVGLTLWKWPAERDRKVRVAATALGVGAVMAVTLLTPVLTGASSPVDAIASRDSAQNPLFGGFSDYWGLREQVFAGSTVVGIVGVAIGILGISQSQTLRRQFLVPFAILLSIFVALATVVHGEVRYLSPVIPWLWLSAGAALVWRFSHMPRPGTLALAVCAVIALAVFAPEQADGTMEYNEGFRNVKKAALMLRADSQCAVLTSLLHMPQVEWYSGCETSQIDHAEHNLKPNISPDATLYLLLAETADGQPQSILIDRYVTETSTAPITIGNSGSRFRQVEIWKLSD